LTPPQKEREVSENRVHFVEEIWDLNNEKVELEAEDEKNQSMIIHETHKENQVEKEAADINTPITKPDAAEMPNAENPNAESPNAESPNAESPNPNTEKPDAEKPDAEKPGTEKLDAEKPDAEVTSEEKPETKTPDTEKSEVESQTCQTIQHPEENPSKGFYDPTGVWYPSSKVFNIQTGTSFLVY